MIEIGELVIYGQTCGTVVNISTHGRAILDTIPNTTVAVEDLKVAPPNYFRKGDYVRVKRDLKHGEIYGGKLRFYDRGSSIKGTIHKITKVSRNGTYYLDGIDGQTFALEMLEVPFKLEDVVALNAEGAIMYPSLLSSINTIKGISKNNCCLIGGILVEPKYLTEVATLSIGEESSSTNFIEKNNYENQLQRKGAIVTRGQRPKGSRVYGRRPKAAVSIGSLSNKARSGYSKG